MMVRKFGLGTVTMVVLATVLVGCYARSFPKEEPSVPTQITVKGVDLTAAVAKAETQKDENVPRINPSDVVEYFAKRLNDEHFFKAVTFPYTELSPTHPDVILEVSVKSTYDLNTNENFLKGIAVGLTLLLLQPVLPTEYDLSLHVAVRALSRDGLPIKQYDFGSDFRFQYTVPRPSEESITQWHTDTIRQAVEALITQIKQDRAVLLRAS